jgi:hypothetical protein
VALRLHGEVKDHVLAPEVIAQLARDAERRGWSLRGGGLELSLPIPRSPVVARTPKRKEAPTTANPSSAKKSPKLLDSHPEVIPLFSSPKSVVLAIPPIAVLVFAR